MADTDQANSKPQMTLHQGGKRRDSLEGRRASGAWVGWIVFAATMMILLGTFNVIDGLVALFNDKWFLATKAGLLTFDFTVWGWAMLILGVAAILAGIGVLSGRMWARIVAVGIAGLNALAQLAFISAYPIWSVLIIALDVIAIYALTAHGKEMAEY